MTMYNPIEVNIDKKSLRILILIQNLKYLVFFLIYIVLYISLFRKFDWPGVAALVLGGLYFGYIIVKYFIYAAFKKPLIIISSEKMVLHRMNFFFRMIPISISYSDIDYLDTDLKLYRGQKRKTLFIKLKDGREISYNLSIVQLDQDDLCRMISQVNPNVKIVNIGEFEYDNNNSNM
jgi:hypothetical protein